MTKTFHYFFLFMVLLSAPLNLGANQKINTTSSQGLEFGNLRYAIHYGKLDADFLYFLSRARINLLHWHGPFQGYNGLPERKKLNSILMDVRHQVKKVHDLGIKVLLYIGPVFSYGDPEKRTGLFKFYDRQWASYSDYLGPRPPEPLQWTQRDEKNRPKQYKWKDNSGYYICPNNTCARQYVKGILKIVFKTGADGIFFDGPFFKDGVCYCEDCRKNFHTWLHRHYSEQEIKNVFGITGEIPLPDKKNKQLWIAWQSFFSDSLADYLGLMKKFANKFRPGFIVTANYWTRNPYDSIGRTGADFQKWSKKVDIAFCESKYKTGPCMEAGRKMSNSALYKYLVGASNGKTVALLKTSVDSLSPEGSLNLTRLCIAEASSNHAVWQFSHLDPFAQKAAIEYNNFLWKKSNLFKKWRPVSDIAVLSSPRQAYYGFKSYDAALSRFFTDSHLSNRIIIDKDLQALSSKTGILVLPMVKVISDDNFRYIANYVEKGGCLIAIGENGIFNENMLRRVSIENRLKGKFHKSPFNSFRYMTIGRGKAFFCPGIKLHLFAREGFTEKELGHLSQLPPLINWLVKSPVFLVDDLDDKVEINLMKLDDGETSSIAMHMVNYGVEIDGRFTPYYDLNVSIRLPEGRKCSSVELFSPDLDKSKNKLPFAGFKINGEDYVRISVTELKIYDIVVCRLQGQGQPVHQKRIKF